MDIEFEHLYQQRVMIQTFAEGVLIENASDVLKWRQSWMGALSTWHSPYKALVDLRGVEIKDTPEVREALANMQRFFEGFFLKKAVGIGTINGDVLPFEIYPDETTAREKVGLKEKAGRTATDFRSSIQVQNHFRNHVMEVSFSQPTMIDDAEKITILKEKITNNLMQWHSAWNLLFDCANLEFDPSLKTNYEQIERFFKGFFLKDTLGYSPKGKADDYPFKVYRARHAAAGRLEAEGAFSADEADCQSRKSPTN